MAARNRSFVVALPSPRSVGGRIPRDHAKLAELEDVFNRFNDQLTEHNLQEKEPQEIDELSQAIEKAKAEVHNLLKLPMEEVLLPHNYKSLVDGLDTYAASHLSAEMAHALNEFRRNLPYIFTEYQKVESWKNDRTRQVKKSLLISELDSATMRYRHLKANHNMLDEQKKEIKRQKKRIVAEEAALTEYCATRVKALEELLADSKDQEKEEVESLISGMEATWANYIEKIVR